MAIVVCADSNSTLIATILPWALLLVIAVVVAVMFLRRKLKQQTGERIKRKNYFCIDVFNSHSFVIPCPTSHCFLWEVSTA